MELSVPGMNQSCCTNGRYYLFYANVIWEWQLLNVYRQNWMMSYILILFQHIYVLHDMLPYWYILFSIISGLATEMGFNRRIMCNVFRKFEQFKVFDVLVVFNYFMLKAVSLSNLQTMAKSFEVTDLPG